jgi:hypothetical protein
MSAPTVLRFSAAVWLVAVIAVAQDTPLKAVPAFARKYQTSCQTCHTIFPKLNAFGEAFRLNGYRMPGETEEMIKEKQVSLGSPAYKKLWPQAIWPGEISSGVPLAVNIKLADVNTSELNDNGSVTNIRNDFQLPQELNVFGAGRLGDHVSYFSEVTFGANPDGSVEVELEHAHIAFDSPFGPENLFHFRIGKIAPNLADGFQEMWIMTDSGMDSFFDFNPIGPNGGTGLGAEDLSPAPIELPALVQGFECYGIVNHRLMYVTGLTNGIPGVDRFDGNNAKDVYARLDYKFGGMGLDGDTTGLTLPPENWRETSLRVGLLGYQGDGTGIFFPLTDESGTTINVEDRRYDRAGVFASLYLGDLNLFGVALRGNDTLRQFDEDGAGLGENKRSYHAWFLQADYVIKPPFQVSLRYETLAPADTEAATLKALNANFTYLIRANVKAMLEYHRDLRDSQNYQVAGVLRCAF